MSAFTSPWHPILVGLTCFALSSPLQADDISVFEQGGQREVYVGNQTPKAQDLVEILQPPDTEARTRGARPATLALNVQFKVGSAILTESGQEQLRALGEALQSKQLQSHSYIVEGHTDKKGKLSRNMTLSQKRAESVRQYLTQNFDIKPSQLKALGLGSNRLIDPADPFNPINRRVTITAKD